LGGGLSLNCPSHGFWLVGVTEELIVLPIVEEEIGTLSSFWFLIGVPGWPSDGGFITRVLPKLLGPRDELTSAYSRDDCGGQYMTIRAAWLTLGSILGGGGSGGRPALPFHPLRGWFIVRIPMMGSSCLLVQ
jgi:hypothetical protein